MKFNDKLQKIRKENNITQEVLADKLNVSRQAVSKWESGQAYPDTEKLIQISKIFNVSLDELINDSYEKDNSNVKKINFMELLNSVLEFITKSFSMFCSMKFLEKVKCLLEMFMSTLVIFLLGMVSTALIENMFRKILVFLPQDLIYMLCGLLETLLILLWLVLGIIVLVKIFKSRYLDYYVIVMDNSVSENVIEESVLKFNRGKEYKVVIRDSKDSSLNIFKKIGKCFSFMFKLLCILFIIPLILLFIFSISILIYSLFYIFSGLFFNGLSITIVGVILFIFLMIEFVYNLLFNRNHAVNRIFIMFIISISLIGVGLGLSFTAISNFSYIDTSDKEVNKHTIQMSDDLVVNCYDMADIVIDNSLDDIIIEVSTYGDMDAYLHKYNSYLSSDKVSVVDVYFDLNEMDLYKNIIDNLVDKKIITNYNYFDIKIYVSSDNLSKLKENYNKYNLDVEYE